MNWILSQLIVDYGLLAGSSNYGFQLGRIQDFNKRGGGARFFRNKTFPGIRKKTSGKSNKTQGKRYKTHMMKGLFKSFFPILKLWFHFFLILNFCVQFFKLCFLIKVSLLQRSKLGTKVWLCFWEAQGQSWETLCISSKKHLNGLISKYS